MPNSVIEYTPQSGGATKYVMLRSNGRIVVPTVANAYPATYSSLTLPSALNPTAWANCALALPAETIQGGSLDLCYQFNFTSITNLPIGWYVLRFYDSAPAVGDIVEASFAAYWDGTNACMGASLVPTGLDSVLVESGITASANLTNDTGTQLTSINARQALALLGAALVGLLSQVTNRTPKFTSAGARITQRISATTADTGRTGVALKVPD